MNHFYQLLAEEGKLAERSSKETQNYQFSLFTQAKTVINRLISSILVLAFFLSFNTQLSAQFTNYCIQVDIDNATNCTFK